MRHLSSCLCPAVLGLELQSKAGDSDLTPRTTHALHLPPPDASQPPPPGKTRHHANFTAKKTTDKTKGAFASRLWGG